MQKKIVLVDMMNLLFRNFCANPSLNEKGVHIGAVAGSLFSLQKIIKDVQPDEVKLVWDGKSSSKRRREINKDYKEGRKVPRSARYNRALDIPFTPEEEAESLYSQQRALIEILNTLPYPQFCEDGTEADDVIAYLNAKYSCAESYLKIIISNDRDFVQLLNKCTILYRPAKHEYITYKSWLLKEGIHPHNLALSRSIEGDNSDNLKGVKGVGRITIAKKFPEFAKEEFITIDKLKELCEAKENDTTSIKILKDIDKVKENYSIMQLYMPMIPAQTALHIDSFIEDYKPEINVQAFEELIKHIGINVSAYTALIMHGLNIVKG